MDTFFYKYREIDDEDDLTNDQSIKSLFNCEAAFSNRKNFNDLFDSKIELVKAYPANIKSLKMQLRKKDKSEISSLINNGKFTPKGEQIINGSIESFNNLIDNYFFYCVSSINNSNLMWSHYASSHKGFCIEFRGDHLEAVEVKYQKGIPKIKVRDLVFQYFQMDNEDLGQAVWGALRTKLEEWSYEREYRYQASSSMLSNAIKSGSSYRIFKYPEIFVESIIFGCRTSQFVKDYIMGNMPFNCKFKQAKEKISYIEIEDIK